MSFSFSSRGHRTGRPTSTSASSVRSSRSVTVDVVRVTDGETNGFTKQEIIDGVRRLYPDVNTTNIDDAINLAIETNYIFGYLGRYFDVASTEPYLYHVSVDFRSLSSFVDAVMSGEVGYNIECWILINNIESLIHNELLESDGMLNIRLHPNYVDYFNGS